MDADKVRIVQVVSNLLHNSQKCVKEGTIEVGIRKSGGEVVVTVEIAVKDTSRYPPDTLHKVCL